MEYAKLKTAPEIILTEYITGIKDIQRGITKTSADLLPEAYNLVESTKIFNIPVYLLTNNRIDYRTPELIIVPTELQNEFPDLSLYFQRWFMAYHFLLKHTEIKRLVLTDLSDVKMLNAPFPAFESGHLYFGDEYTTLAVPIIANDKKSDFIQKFLEDNRQLQTLNPGVIGGERAIVLEFLGILINLITQTLCGINQGISGYDLGRYEMAWINYVAYRYFPTRLRHGRQVSTIFHFNHENVGSWFKHK